MSLHALTEARKDGLTTDDLEAAVMSGNLVEDYGERALLLYFAPDYQIPVHLVLEFIEPDERATIVTAYVPDRTLWETDWMRRKRLKSKGKKKKR